MRTKHAAHDSELPEEVTPERGPRDGRDNRHWELTDEIREAIHADVDALPPMTDGQIDAIAEVIIAARERRHRARRLTGERQLNTGHD
jgi:hypothetical protein